MTGQTLFPFMADVNLKCYIKAENEDMKDMYDTLYRSTGMRYTHFVINIYIPNFAKLWADENEQIYFDENVVRLEDYLK